MKYSIRRYIALTAAAAIAALPLVSCKKSKSGNGEPSVQIAEGSEVTTAAPTVPAPSETYPQYPVSFPEIEEKDTGDLYEAENAAMSGPLTREYDKENYSGDGYITGFANDGSSYVTFNINVPSNQHYDLSLNIASKKQVDCIVSLNGNPISSFKSTSDGKFTQITLHGVFLTKGRSEIEVRPQNGNICLDYLKICNSDALGSLGYEADGSLSNENAGESAKRLMSFLAENYGKFIITGQYTADNDNSELDLIYSTTGKYPVIRFTDFSIPKGTFDESFRCADACTEWYRNGGIAGVTWFWSSPSGRSSVYTDESDFVLADAVTDKDIALLDQEEIRGLYGEGKISEQTYSLILDIDNMAGQLTALKNRGVPVLWRPLPEGSGNWYWWGASGSSAYKWLWHLMYTRFTQYFGLDNLIWIWNGQSSSTLVDSSEYDIAAVDLYFEGERDYGNRFYEKFAAMQKLVGKDKLIAISECGSIPDADRAFRDNSVWSFFALWSGKYIENENGEYSDEFTSSQSLIRLYNSAGALTLDEYREMTGFTGADTPQEDTSSAETSEEASAGASSEAGSDTETDTDTVTETDTE